MRRLLGENLISSIALTHSLKVTRGWSVSDFRILSRPSLPPTARCVPSCEKHTLRHWNPTLVARRSSRLLASQSRTLELSAAVLKMLGRRGCVAHAYRSAVCPFVSGRAAAVSLSSHKSFLLVPHTKFWDPGRESTARIIGAGSSLYGLLSCHLPGLRVMRTAPRPSVADELPVSSALVPRSAEPSALRAADPCFVIPDASWSCLSISTRSPIAWNASVSSTVCRMSHA
mmetsp:Transcript_4886/g.16941  ORF Transcript_4886/g.16941 Transcript_4886/m.16941 type:complete len:229 (-) Transcript_4886:685-1371(-)